MLVLASGTKELHITKKYSDIKKEFVYECSSHEKKCEKYISTCTLSQISQLRQDVCDYFKGNVIRYVNDKSSLFRAIFCDEDKIIDELTQLVVLCTYDVYLPLLVLKQIPSLKILTFCIYGVYHGDIELIIEYLKKKDSLCLNCACKDYEISEMLLLKSEMIIDPTFFSFSSKDDLNDDIYKSLDKYKDMTKNEIMLKIREIYDLTRCINCYIDFGFLFIIREFV
jgi:hypothetical protein